MTDSKRTKMDIVTFKEIFIPMNRLLYGQALRMLRDPLRRKTWFRIYMSAFGSVGRNFPA